MAEADMMMAEVNALMIMAQEESAAAQSKIDTAVTTQNQADVALDTLKIHFSIHHSNPFHRHSSHPAHLNTYIKDDRFQAHPHVHF